MTIHSMVMAYWCPLWLLQFIAIADTYPPKPQRIKMNKCINRLMVFEFYQVPFGLKTAYCLIIRDTNINYWLTKNINLLNPMRYAYTEQDTVQDFFHI